MLSVKIGVLLQKTHIYCIIVFVYGCVYVCRPNGRPFLLVQTSGNVKMYSFLCYASDGLKRDNSRIIKFTSFNLISFVM